MSVNSFFCPYCDEITKHFSVSAAELAAQDGESEAGQLLLRIGKYIGTESTISVISGRRFWKCEKCGVIYCCKSSGKIV